ncbi:uncharacterized protein LOC125231363 [Leguminivora glycinivorella]|uniref:uncharacterized protein LOC125231363 n=1 Tax=Leguminivora glycinivorella TaxID=1035111 RepID=UPI00200D1E5E|nr:uncharacterized protein LOC125231363 [Leguminivora glycinivorella]
MALIYTYQLLLMRFNLLDGQRSENVFVQNQFCVMQTEYGTSTGLMHELCIMGRMGAFMSFMPILQTRALVHLRMSGSLRITGQASKILMTSRHLRGMSRCRLERDTSYTSATRKLLTSVFTRRELATHSLTGKSSPAFPGKPAKKRLDPELVNDIVQIVVEKSKVNASLVRTTITTKCADESKMYRSRQKNKNKRLSNQEKLSSIAA